jgi:glycosyltransferase involved in cell wall biosynthesis
MNRAGIETWLMHLLRHFDRREIAFDFLVYDRDCGTYDDEIRSLGARILRCPFPRPPWKYAICFLRLLKQYGPYDAVHSHSYFFCGVDMRLASLAGVPLRISHLHPVRDIEDQSLLRGLYQRFMGRWIARFGNLVLSPSQASLDAFSKFADLTSIPRMIVRNCVASSSPAPADRIRTRQELGLPPDRRIILYVARFVPHKNHLLLVDIAARLEQLGLSAHFVVAGSEGTARIAFEQRIAGRSDFSVFVDQADLTPLFRCADLFVFPSLEEGFGVVAIEAAAAGVPVVATDLPGIREACSPGHRAYMFAPNDAPDAARKIHKILSQPDLHRTLSEEGSAWVRQFSLETVASQLRRIYGAAQGASVVGNQEALA